MPDPQHRADKQEETAEEIFHEISDLISKRLREGRPQTPSHPAAPATMEDDIKEELRRLREAILQDERAYAASREPNIPQASTATPAAGPSIGQVAPSAGDAFAEGVSRAAEVAPAAEPQDEPTRARGEMSEGLKILFGQPQSPEPIGGQSALDEITKPAPAEPASVGQAQPSGASGLQEAVAEPPVAESPYFTVFVRGLAHPPASLATGLGTLDEILDGGFEPGLYVIAGPAGSGGRALMQNILWKTVSDGRTALFYCLATGTQRVWEEMIVTLSHLLDDSPVSRADLRGEASGARREDIRRLDAILMQTFLPNVTLHDRLPAGPFPLSAFLSELGGGMGPSAPPALVLLDGLPQLTTALHAPDALTAGSLLLELDVLLRNRGVSGLLLSEGAAGSRGRLEEQGLEHLGSGLLAVRRHRGRRRDRMGEGLAQLSVRVLKQPRGCRQGRVSLVLDTASGMLAEAPARPEMGAQEQRGR